jgi:flagellar motor switch/type III secretory pathway protein FliN
MAVAQVRLPMLSIERQALDYWNAATSHAGRSIALGEGGASFSYNIVKPSAEELSGFLVTLHNGVELLVRLIDFPFAERFEADLDYGRMRFFSAAFREAIDSGILAAIRAALPVDLDMAISSFRWQTPEAMGERLQVVALSWFEISLLDEDGKQPVRLMVGMEPGKLRSVLGEAEIAGRRALGTLAASIRRRLYYAVAVVELALDEVLTLGVGDLVVLGAKSDGTVLNITGGDPGYVFNYVDQRWVCKRLEPQPYHRARGAWRRSGGNVSERKQSIETDAAGTGSPSIAIPVTVEFHVGELDVTLSELESWQPGRIVELDPPRLNGDVEVKIHVNGQYFGRGDLVRIDDRLAVRISRLETDPAPDHDQRDNEDELADDAAEEAVEDEAEEVSL